MLMFMTLKVEAATLITVFDLRVRLPEVRRWVCQNMSYAHYTHNYAVWVMGLAN